MVKKFEVVYKKYSFDNGEIVVDLKCDFLEKEENGITICNDEEGYFEFIPYFMIYSIKKMKIDG
jgi:uncharacterized GH25 family protein